MEPQPPITTAPTPVPPPATPKPKNNSFIIILLSVLLLLATFLDFFFALQTQKLAKQLVQIQTSASPSPSPAETPAAEGTPSPDTTAGWKTYDSECGFSIKHPKEWNSQKYFIQESSDACAYIKAPDYQQSTDTREGLYIDISKTKVGSTSKNITINSLDNYIKSLENISEPPTKAKNIENKTYGVYQGKQFDLSFFEFQTTFAFIHNNYIYSVVWPTEYAGTYKNLLEQILSTFKFID